MKISPVLVLLGIGATLSACQQDVPIGASSAGTAGSSGGSAGNAAGSDSTTIGGGFAGATTTTGGGIAGTTTGGGAGTITTGGGGGAAGSTTGGGGGAAGSTTTGGGGVAGVITTTGGGGVAGTNTSTGGGVAGTNTSTGGGGVAGASTTTGGGVAGSDSMTVGGGIAGSGPGAGSGGSAGTSNECAGPPGWSTVGGTFRRTNASCLAGPTTQPAVKWKVEGTATSVAVGADGTIYAVTGQQVNAWHADGTPRWTSPLPADQPNSSALTVAASGTLYLQGSSVVRAFDANGKEASYPIKTALLADALTKDDPAPITNQLSSVMEGPDGALYLSVGGILAVLDPVVYQTGSFAAAIKRKTPMSPCFSAYAISHPSLALDGSVYITCSSSDGTHLVAVGPDGVLKWVKSSGPATDNGGSLSTASVVMIGQDGTIYTRGVGQEGTIDRLTALHPDGTERWSTPFSSNDQLAGMAPDGTFYVASPYTGFPSDENRKLRAHHPDSTLAWDATFQRFGGLAIGADGTLYVNAEVLFAIGNDGQMRWGVDTTLGPSTKPGPPVLGPGGTVLVRDPGSGNTVAFGP